MITEITFAPAGGWGDRPERGRRDGENRSLMRERRKRGACGWVEEKKSGEDGVRGSPRGGRLKTRTAEEDERATKRFPGLPPLQFPPCP